MRILRLFTKNVIKYRQSDDEFDQWLRQQMQHERNDQMYEDEENVVCFRELLVGILLGVFFDLFVIIFIFWDVKIKQTFGFLSIII